MFCDSINLDCADPAAGQGDGGEDTPPGDPAGTPAHKAGRGASAEACGGGSIFNKLAGYCSLAADRLEHLGGDRFFDPSLQKARTAWAE